MRIERISLALFFILATVAPASRAQTLQLNDAETLIAHPWREGFNIGCINYYFNCQTNKDLVSYTNPGFEPSIVRRILDLTAEGTRTTFNDPNQYAVDPPGYLDGATFQIVESIRGGPEKGCSGTVASSTGPNRSYISAWKWDGSVITFTGPNSFIAGESNVVIPELEKGRFLVGKSGLVTAATPDTFTVRFKAPIPQPASSSEDFGFVQTAEKYVAPKYTIHAATNQGKAGCDASFKPGDILVLTKTFSPTPQTWWEHGYGGVFNSALLGSAQMLSEISDLCASCGSQSLDLHFPNTGGSIQFLQSWDTNPTEDIFVLMNGTYQLSFWAKAASGNPTLSVKASRSGAGGFSCGPFNPALTTAWTQYTYTCDTRESAAIVGSYDGNAGITVRASNTTGPGDIYFDQLSFQKTSPINAANTSAFRDEVMQPLYDAFPAPCAAPGTIRYWVNQNAETIDNWTRPNNKRSPSGVSYGISPGGQNEFQLSLEDFLDVVKDVQTVTGCPVDPYIEVPVTFTNAEAAHLIEFLAAPASATTSEYGQRRVALGQSDSWTSVFQHINLSYCNECWNQSFGNQNIRGDSSGASTVYHDYATRTGHIFAAMRANRYYPRNITLTMDLQTATNWSADKAVAEARPDAVEIEDYSYGKIGLFDTPEHLYQPLYAEIALQSFGPKDPHNFYTSWKDYTALHTCGASGTEHCIVNIYEQGEGTIAGTIANSQRDLDHITAGAGYGLAAALQALLHQQAAPHTFGPQNFFSLTEFRNGTSGHATAKLWGALVEAGGAESATNPSFGGYIPRPDFVAMRLANQSVIGPMFSCPISENVHYRFEGSTTNGPEGSLPAIEKLPYLYAFCFKNGPNRSILLFNMDTHDSHTISFAGTHLPTGSVTMRQYSVAADPNAMNEADTGSYTGRFKAEINQTTQGVPAPTTLTLPPYSATAIDYKLSADEPTPEPSEPKANAAPDPKP
ncbi:hypothetical protein ACFPT7_02285 [Acidicapsa dinghuensis]|uniref:CBM-cenC domain-containing protein n=1 Tax=Acidicapsa dinghuensis TaxID=2218256 RepID=A0ABW1ECJ3_9BACT|nr:hypothetical protein [Acidicapsa dinghuensis]